LALLTNGNKKNGAGTPPAPFFASPHPFDTNQTDKESPAMKSRTIVTGALIVLLATLSVAASSGCVNREQDRTQETPAPAASGNNGASAARRPNTGQ
jgi:hypothetical protein